MGGCAGCSSQVPQDFEEGPWAARQRAIDDAAASAVYSPLDAARVIENMEAQFLRNAVLQWVVMPAFALICAMVPLTAPTCSSGYNDVMLVVALLAQAYQLYTERSAWASLRSLLSPPELQIMRQLGVLRRRGVHALLGTLEGLDHYADLAFPFIARSCGEQVSLTLRWAEAWREEPFVGDVVADALHAIRFWRLALLFCTINVVVTGFFGLEGIRRHVLLREELLRMEHGTCSRIPGEVFYTWARSASTAMMPSVTSLCEAMGSERAWVYDGSKDASASTEARFSAAFGRMTPQGAAQLELQDFDVQARVERAGYYHYVRLLIVKVFIGNLLLLWLQGVFFALTLESTGFEAKAKVGFSMVLTAITAVWRCAKITPRVGCIGCVVSVVIVFFIVWTALVVQHAFTCPDHVWTMSSGCVRLATQRG